MAGNTDADRLSGKWAKREGATKNQMARAGFKQSCGGERLKIASKVREKAYSSQLPIAAAHSRRRVRHANWSLWRSTFGNNLTQRSTTGEEASPIRTK